MGKSAPVPSTSIFSNIRQYLLHNPGIETIVEHHSTDDRDSIVKRILQRTGIDVENYKMLNIHQVGIEAPASYVFDELMEWNGDSICWPNYLAKVVLQNNQLDHIKIYVFGITKRIFGLSLFHLFDLSSIKIQRVPASSDFDNARYLIYECKGGYPIGIFSMFVRSSIPERGEKEMSQLFMMVSFNFYGRKNKKVNIFNKAWERIHNRATSNILSRLKQLCEWKFETFVND